ncbi:hypothetical protein [Sphingobium sp. 22B]|jgi:hypothetical protein|nr:hypothetical protein [Sphingobium sp. 22B]
MSSTDQLRKEGRRGAPASLRVPRELAPPVSWLSCAMAERHGWDGAIRR